MAEAKQERAAQAAAQDSALMRALNVRSEMLAGVASDGAVTVEGQYVGKLLGVSFEPAQGSSVLEEKALRAAAVAAVGPEIAKRLGKLASEPDEAFSFTPDGVVHWHGEAAGAIAGGPVGAAIGAAANAVLQKPLGQITSKTYRVTGPWKEPKVEVISREQGRVSRAGDRVPTG